LIAQEWALRGDSAEREREQKAARRQLLEEQGFVPVTGQGHTMVAIRRHLYEDARILLDKQTSKYEAMIVEFALKVPVLGTKRLIIGSAHFHNVQAKKALATEWARDLFEEAVALRCAIMGGDWNRMHKRMAETLARIPQPTVFIETPSRQEDVVGLIVWAPPLVKAHLVAKYFSYYNQDLQWNVGDTDSHYMLAAYFRDPKLPSGARMRNPATEAERRRRQQAARNERKRAAPEPASGSGASSSARPRPTTRGP
jgi:hypothetical protein